uniref:Uncharacterized protein n=1 Tax=Panagrolaimus sp. JU765 TaxID=591449 RepID=A0AC34QWF5_9BILA
MDETEQSSAGESDELNQQDEINLKIEPTFQKSSSSSSGFHEQWSCSDEWDFVNKKYRTTIYAKGTFPKRLISPPTPEELADDYDPWV